MREQYHPGTLYVGRMRRIEKDRSERGDINVSEKVLQCRVNRNVFPIVPVRQVLMEGTLSPFD
jgi:hypothetical protein